MHQQIRLVCPTGSPQDVAKPLRDLKAAGINLIGVSGSNVEHGGEAAFSVEDDDMAAALKALSAYSPRTVDVLVCWLKPSAPGQLLACIQQGRHDPRFSGKLVRDVSLTTVTNDQGEVGVQVFFDDPD